MEPQLKTILAGTDNYNFHSHTQFCDGRDSMEDIAVSARNAGMTHFGFSPHSPVPVESPCNMSWHDMDKFLDECRRLRDIHAGVMGVYSSLEIDGLGDEYGPFVDRIQSLPLDYRLGSVHFVPTQSGVYVDCDGSPERFKINLKDAYGGDLRYVVEKYFENVLVMIERGGFELLGHFDKIAGNASAVCPAIEDEHWFEALVDDVIENAVHKGLVVEINTKAFDKDGRFYPAERWWRKLIDRGAVIAVDSDAHYASKVTSGREEALRRLRGLSQNNRW